MIITEIIEINGVKYRYTYSDLSVYIEDETDTTFQNAVDPIDTQRQYIESNIKIQET